METKIGSRSTRPRSVRQAWATGVVQGRSGSLGASQSQLLRPPRAPGASTVNRQTRPRLGSWVQSGRLWLCTVVTEGVRGARAEMGCALGSKRPGVRAQRPSTPSPAPTACLCDAVSPGRRKSSMPTESLIHPTPLTWRGPGVLVPTQAPFGVQPGSCPVGPRSHSGWQGSRPALQGHRTGPWVAAAGGLAFSSLLRC